MDSKGLSGNSGWVREWRMQEAYRKRRAKHRQIVSPEDVVVKENRAGNFRSVPEFPKSSQRFTCAPAHPPASVRSPVFN